MEKKKKQFNYPQKFRQAWKKDPKLKDWLRENEQIPNKSYCIYCKCDLISKYCDLLNHATTKKHLRAAVSASSQQLTDSLPMIKDMANDMEIKIDYSSNQIEIDQPVAHMKAERAKPVKKACNSKAIDCGQEIPIEYNESIQADCDDDDDEEFTEILNLADSEFETISTTTLQEKKLKAEIEYFQQKTEYFAKLTENTKIHKTLMMLQARKLNLEIKRMQNEY